MQIIALVIRWFVFQILQFPQVFLSDAAAAFDSLLQEVTRNYPLFDSFFVFKLALCQHSA
jgi:hypothetical protein